MFVEWKTVAALTPELILILTASLVFVGGAFVRNGVGWSIVAFLGYALAAVALEFGGSESVVQTGPILIDGLANTFRGLAIVTGAVITMVAAGKKDDRLAPEIFGSIQLATAGMMFASGANDLVLLFLGLELISVPTYVLLFLGRRDAATSEATMKYFFLSILSSAILLYGLSFLYGIGGTTLITGTEAIPGIREAVLRAGVGGDPATVYFLPFALVLTAAGLCFKLAAVPFHFYAPDVYQGTTNVNAGLLSVAPKLAGVAGAVRLLLIALPNDSQVWQLALVLSVITMTVGNICALWQTNLRRMMAYSAIAHAGYLLIGLATAAAPQVGTSETSGGVAGMTIYLIVYALATLGTFAALAAISTDRKETSTLSEIAGLGFSRPALSAAIAVCMFSLAGLPPLAGFWGKLSLLFGSMNLSLSAYFQPASAGGSPPGIAIWFGVLSLAGVLNAAIAAAYYLRVISVMYFQSAPAEETAAPPAGGPHFAALLCATAVLIFGMFPGSLLRLSENAEKQLPRVVRSLPPITPVVVARE